MAGPHRPIRARHSSDPTPVACLTVLLPLAIVTTMGCSEPSHVDSEITTHDAAAILIESGDNQEGLAGEPLPESLAVRVSDSRGENLSGVFVRWSVTSGEGLIGTPDTQPTYVSEPVAPTRDDGVSLVRFVPRAPGPITVRARVESDPSLTANFSADATGVLIAIRLSVAETRNQSTTYVLVAPDGSSDVTVPVGYSIEWENQTEEADVWSDCPDVRPCPPGGTPFDSGLLELGERFRFVPGVAGTWDYQASATWGWYVTRGKLIAAEPE